ncbi:MAG: ORF6N domain-containing protein [Chitinophagales bacterium]
MFQLNEQEVELMVSQNAIPSKKQLGGTLPYAFTEHGILMLANVLKSERAIKVRTHLKNMFALVFSSIRSLAEALEAAHTGGSTGNSSNEG